MKGYVARPQEKRRLIRRILIAAAIVVVVFVLLLSVGLMLHARSEYLREHRALYPLPTDAASRVTETVAVRHFSSEVTTL